MDMNASLNVMGKKLATSEFLVRCYHNMVVLLGRDRMNTYPLTGEVAVGTPSTDLDTTKADQWIKMNWITVLKHIGKGLRKKYKLDQAIPVSGTDTFWIKVLRAVLTHFGLGLHTQKDSKLLQIVPLSFWKQMNVDTVAFGSWLTSHQSKHYGPTPVIQSPCAQCAAPEQVACRMQRGLACCIKHRNRKVLLDFPEIDADEGPESDEGSDDEQKQYIMDRLLRYIGFKEGRRSTDTLTHEQMQAAVAASVAFTQNEVDQVQRLFETDLTQWSDAKIFRRQLKALMKTDQEHTHVTLVLGQVGRGINKKSTWTLQKSKWNS
jgi:hypothetical protein